MGTSIESLHWLPMIRSGDSNEKDRVRRIVRIKRITLDGPGHGCASFGARLDATPK